MSKYVVLQESQVNDLRQAVAGLMAAGAAILEDLDAVAGTLDLAGQDTQPIRETRHTIKPKQERKRTDRLADVLLGRVPDRPFTARQALESVRGYYQFTGKKNREIDSVRNALRTSEYFQRTNDGLFRKKEAGHLPL